LSAAAAESRQLSAAAAAIAAISVVGIAFGLGMPLLSTVMENRGYSASLIGLNTASAGVASLAAAPLVTPVAARFGVVKTLCSMNVAAALSLAGFYLFESFAAWAILRVCLHFALTFLFILSEFWISASAPPQKRGLLLGVYATFLSIGFAIGPWLFSLTGSAGFLPFGLGAAVLLTGLLPVIWAWSDSPALGKGEKTAFAPYLTTVPTATAAVLVFGAVETGGFSMLPVYGTRLGFSEADSALWLTIIGAGNVTMQLPLGLLSDWVRDRRHLLVALALFSLTGVAVMTAVTHDWTLLAIVFFLWGGAVGGLYTVGLAHLGSRLTGRDLASANAAFIFCYAIGMLLGPQMIGIFMDEFGPNGFSAALSVFFVLYIALATQRIVFVRQQG
jgi:MFS family permease